MYADHVTGSLERAIRETDRRRTIQLAYNKTHGITPKSIEKAIRDILPTETEAQRNAAKILALESKPIPHSGKALEALIKEKEKEMKEAAAQLDFELAAILRDEVRELLRQEGVSHRAKPALTKRQQKIKK